MNRVVRLRSDTAIPEKTEFAETLAAIQKKYGKSVISPASKQFQPERIPTGIFLLDLALLGGIPHNRITLFSGNRHSGKSLLCHLCIAHSQQQFPEYQCIKADIEGASDPVWSAKLGVDVDRLYVFSPETGESAADSVDALIRTKEVSLVAVDSIAALTPVKELDSSAADVLIAMQARLTTGILRKATSALIAERNRGHYVTVIFTNQFRMKIGGYGDNRTMPGGKAAEHFPSVQIELKNKETMGKDEYDIDTVLENEHSFIIKKNRLNGGLRMGEFRLIRSTNNEFGLPEGAINDAGTLLTYSKKFGFYTGGGTSWKLDVWGKIYEFRKADDVIKVLYEDKDLYWQLRNQAIMKYAESLGMPKSFLQRFAS